MKYFVQVIDLRTNNKYKLRVKKKGKNYTSTIDKRHIFMTLCPYCHEKLLS